MTGLLLVAVALGLSNFAAGIAIGLNGVDGRLRIRIAVIFGFFEAVMPLVGLLIGHRVATSIGAAATYVGGGLLMATGAFTYWQARRDTAHVAVRPTRGPQLIVTGAALSVDNLIVGFALGSFKIPLAVAAGVIAVVSVAMSLAGLELGKRIGPSVERWSGEVAGGLLIGIGVLVVIGLI